MRNPVGTNPRHHCFMGFFSKLHRSKGELIALPRFSGSRPTLADPSSLRQGSSLFARCSRPTLARASPRSPPSSSLQLRSFLGSLFTTRASPSKPCQAWRTRSIAERVVEAIKRERVRDETKTKHGQYNLCCLGISIGWSCKMQVRRNSDLGYKDGGDERTSEVINL
ncbi:hypothetical protein BT93_L4877 [Corymbia citriodora subsp. variegata]|uniref:Uncharacterized protein n=1 Tax=Corymbia citriodora subsp. variegata TaxID=360336 RepID=A0A8T0CTT0_CORYI|nr:hypothetical protein BT93_L4877 [Corymbia citriodora subsp. variegata]